MMEGTEDFDAERAPGSGDEEAAQLEHDRACQRFRECHDEQVRWHEADLDMFGRPLAAADKRQHAQ